ncbi:MAG: CvpA family protein [Thiohalocapsa sp.]
MNPLDLAVVAIIVLSAIFAFARGFVREALSIIAWVGAAAITLFAFSWVFTQIDQRVHNPLLSQVIAGFGLFILSLVALTILTGFVARMVRGSALSPIDRTLGFIFGLARGALLVCLAYLLLDLTLPQSNDRPQWIREAKSGPYLHEGADTLKGFLPESLKNKGTEAAGELMRQIDPRTGDPKAVDPKTGEPRTGDPRTGDPNAAAKADAERAMRAFETPTPAAAPKPETASSPAYTRGDKRQLDRLIGTQR